MNAYDLASYVVNIYGYCGNSGIFEYSDGGDINDAVWPDKGDSDLTNMQKLKIATQVSIGVADLHNVDKEGVPSIAHTDITPGQFILIDNVYKLNDFNRCRFLRWSSEKNEACRFHVGQNPGKNRAPEEYAHEDETEKVDIYSMGNIFYIIVTELWPFEGVKETKAQKKIMQGDRPPVEDSIRDNADPAVKALLKAMEMCWRQDPKERATAREVNTFLKAKLRELDRAWVE